MAVHKLDNSDPMRRTPFSVVAICLAWSASALSFGAAEEDPPYLRDLYTTYRGYEKKLLDYSKAQGFVDYREQRATVLHEMIHVASAAHGGFFIAGQYYAPYLSPSAWPQINNQEVARYVNQDEIRTIGPIYSSYMPMAPLNTMANELDEINAYGQTLPMICHRAPNRAGIHVDALSGHLALLEKYFQILYERNGKDFVALQRNVVSRGAIETIVARAYSALNECFASGIESADPRRIPKRFTSRYAQQK